jgi:hypothetical protein
MPEAKFLNSLSDRLGGRIKSPGQNKDRTYPAEPSQIESPTNRFYFHRIIHVMIQSQICQSFFRTTLLSDQSILY